MARTPRPTLLWLTALVAACLFSVAAFLSAAEQAGANVAPTLNATYPTSTKAGAHSNYRQQISVNPSPTSDDVKRMVLDYPAGLIGDPNAITAANRCNIDYTGVTATSGSPNYANCPASSRIGTINVSATSGLTCGPINLTGGIYLLRNRPTADPEVPTHLGINVSGSAQIWLLFCAGLNVNLNFTAQITLRPTDQGLRVAMIDDLVRTDPLIGGAITVETMDLTVNGMAPAPSTKPFLTNPTRCDDWTTKVYMSAYDSNTNLNEDIIPPAGNDHVSASSSTTPDCTGIAAYNPSFTLTQSNTEAGRPVGLLAVLDNPVTTDSSLQPSYAKTFSMPLPVGFKINPAIANRLGSSGCTEGEFNQADPESVPTCPSGSQVGTVAVAAPEITGDLTGRLYLGHPQAGDVAARRYRLYIWAARGGVAVKIPGRAIVDAGTGQVVVSFGDSSYSNGLPQFNYSKFTLDFNTASAGVGSPSSGPISSPNDNQQMIVNPQVCGTYQADTTLTPWTNPTQAAVVKSNNLTVTSGTNGDCDFDSFSPSFVADVSDTGAGKHPDLTLTVTRPDRTDNLRDAVFRFPDGMAGAIPAATVCTSTDVQADNCAASSQVGTVAVQGGSGPDLATMNGKIYMTEPDPGDTAKLAVIVPAVVGPFDLGNVIIYSDMTLSGTTTFGLQASVEDMPQSIEGIPILYRSVSLQLDGIINGTPFLQNPSVCDTLEFQASLTSNGDISGTSPGSGSVETVVRTDDDQSTSGCPQAFNPTFAITPTTTETAKPTGLTVDVTVPQTTSGADSSTVQQSTINRVQVTFPSGVQMNPGFTNGLTACSTTDIDAGGDACASSSQIGTVVVNTPLLAVPVNGKLVLETPGSTATTRYKFALILDMPGGKQIVRGGALVSGSTDIVGGLGSKDSGSGQIIADFAGLPDVPYSQMTLNFNGATPMFVNAPTCGSQTFDAVITPTTTGGATVNRDSSYTTSDDGAGAPCPPTDPWSAGNPTPSFSQTVSTTVANEHPDLGLTVTRGDKDQLLRDINFSLPVGMTGAAAAVPTCSQVDADAANCAASTQVGTLTTEIGSGSSLASLNGTLHNTAAPGNRPAKLTAILPVVLPPFDLGKMAVPVDVKLRQDLGLDATVNGLPQRYEGIAVRYRSMAIAIDGTVGGNPYMTNPSTCGTNTTTATMTSTLDQTVVRTQNYTTTGCPFDFGSDPTFTAAPTTTETQAPTGLNVSIDNSADNPTIKRVRLTFPDGTTINPAVGNNGANTTCSTALIDAGGSGCPAASNQGTVTIQTHLLPGSYSGNVYLEEPGTTAADRYRLAMVVALPGQDLIIRGVATVDGATDGAPAGTGSVDTGTGQVVADFDDLPDLAWTDMDLALSGGPRALLINPPTCGAKTINALITPNSGGASTTPSSNYTTTADCTPGFTPSFTASVSTTTAGASPDLTLGVTNPGKSNQLRNFNVHLPVGLAANTTAAPQCAQVDANAGNCAGASTVGSVTTEIGNAGETLSLAGTIHNVVPDNDEPARLQAVVPVVVGPFNLGKLSVPVNTELRDDMGVDANTQLPLRYEGITVRIRSMQMVIDGVVGGNDYLVNPSACSTTSIGADMISADPTTVSQSSAVTFDGCPRDFGTAPTFSVTPSTMETATPVGLTFDIGSDADNPTISNIEIDFPAGMEINPAVGNGPLTACTTAQIDAGGAACEATTAKLGTVSLDTPLLPTTQTGSVYLETPGTTAGTRYKVALVVHLPGKDLIVRGAVTVDGSSTIAPGGNGATDTGTGQVSAVFSNIPDLGFSDISVAFNSGPRALFVNPRACTSTDFAAALTPHGGGTVANLTDSYATDSDCGVGFAPTFDGSVSTTDSAANPDVTLEFDRPAKDRALRDISISLPTGLVAATTATSRCAQATAATGDCAAGEAVGTVAAEIGNGTESLALSGNVYNVEPNSDEPARLSATIPVVVGPFDLGKLNVPIATSLRADFGVDATAQLPLRYEGIAVRMRSLDVELAGQVGGNDFMINPSKCQVNTVQSSMTSEGPTPNTVIDNWAYTTDSCGNFATAPTLSVTPSTTVAGDPVGLTVGIDSDAQNSTIGRVQLAMPEGIEVNPAFANGLNACSTVDVDAGACDPADAIADVTLATHLLGTNPTGKVYVEEPGTTATTRYKLAMIVDLPGRKLIVRGAVTLNGSTTIPGGGLGALDSGTGQLVADFNNIPDLGFTNLTMTFASGPRAMLVNPTTCTSASFAATITPNSGGADATPSDAYTPTGCTSTFDPTFTASVDDTQAGGHPDLTLNVTRPDKDEQLRDLEVQLPVGLVASTTATTTRCSQIDAAAGNCAVGEEVGTFTTSIGSGSETYDLTGGKIYNVVPNADEPARLQAVIDVQVGPYNLGKLSLPITTELRADMGVTATTQLPLRYEGIAVRLRSMNIVLGGMVGGEPFITNPSKCQSNTITGTMTSGESTVDSDDSSFTTTGCAALTAAYDPSISASVNPNLAGTPTALTFGMTLPAGSATTSRVQLTLPEGMEISPGVGNGLVACTTAQINAGGAACLASTANLGTISLTTPLLPGVQSGEIFLETPGSTASDRYKLALVIHLPGRDLIVRGGTLIDGSSDLTGGLGSTDTGTGRVTADFPNLPDLGFTEMTVAFSSGGNKLLVNPKACATHTVGAAITPSSDSSAVNRTTTFDTVNGTCDNATFAPTLTGSISDPARGGHPDLQLNVANTNGTDELKDLVVHLPAGLAANTTTVAQCAQLDAAAGNCLAATAVGTVVTTIGSGSETYDVAGTIHNVVPNADEPARLQAVIPVAVGPFDLGKLSVPLATSFNADFSIDVAATMPTRYEGIAVRIRAMAITVEGQPGGNDFITAPNKCGTHAVSATMTSDASNTAADSFDINVTGCPADFAVDPTLTVSGTSSTTAEPTGLTLDIDSDPTNSSISAVTTTMPAGMSINPAVGNSIDACSTAALDAGATACPAESQIGTVSMVTPLLPGTQTGTVYLETPGNTAATRYKLAIVLDLPGRALVVRGTATVDGSSDLVDGLGSKDTGNGNVVASFPDIPDLNFSDLTVAFASGPDALLTNAETCGVQTVSAEFTPHSGGVTSNASDTYATSYDGSGGACPGSEAFSPTFTASVSTTQSAGNPNLVLNVTRADKTEQLREFNLSLPPGLVADTVKTPRCTQAVAALGTCAANTQVGTVVTQIGTGTELLTMNGGLYNVETDPNEPARLAAIIDVIVGPYNLGKLSIPVTTELVTGALPSDLAIDTKTTIPSRYEGVPVRIRSMQIQVDGVVNGNPFMINPSQCATHTITANMKSTLGTDSAVADTFDTTDCNLAPYAPSVEADFSTSQIGKPVGLDLAFVFGGASSSTKKIKTLFPEGMDINPGVGNYGAGMTCDPADVDAGGGACPAASKLGDVKLDTPLLQTQQTGAIYLETPGGTAATRYKLGVFVDLPGAGDLVVHGTATVDGSSDVSGGLGSKDTGTGRVVAEFDSLPDLSFSRLEINFKTTGAGEHALLTNPTTCGTFDVTAEMSPWSRPTTSETVTDSFTTDSDGSGGACPGSVPQNPSLTAAIGDNNPAGPAYAAGAHQDLTLTVARPDNDQGIRNVKILLPKGLMGSADAAPTCLQVDADAGDCATSQPASKIGDVTLQVGDSSDTYEISGGLFNTVAPSNRPAKLTFIADVQVGPFNFGKISVPVDVNLDPNEYNLVAETGNMPQRFEGIPVRINQMTMHLDGIADQATPGTPGDDKPFLTNPHSCGATLDVRAEITSPGASTVTRTAALAGPFTGCASLNLDDNDITVDNVNNAAEQPTALNVEITQGTTATQATMKSLNLTLPGFRLNAPAADGLEACTAAQLDSESCPAASQVGTAWIDTSLLPMDQVNPDNGSDPNLHSLWGKVYLETPGNAPDGSDRYKLAIQLSGKTLITIRGVAKVNEATGEITTEFTDLPDIPFEKFRVELTGGTTPLLLNPIGSVGAASQVTSQATMTSHAGTADKVIDRALDVDANSAKSFSPSTAVALSTHHSGAHPNALFTITRADGQQDIRNVNMALPPGFLGSAAAVPQCAVATAAAGGCPASSQVGTVTAKVGQAGKVLTLPGQVYLTTGVGGDIAGMSIKVAATAGPYNLGSFVTQGRITLRPNDQGISVNFADVPRMFKGVPTHIQELKIHLPGVAAPTGKPFLFNASNCAPFNITNAMASWDGAGVNNVVPYQATGCPARPFAPAISFAAHGGGRTEPPAWTITLANRQGDSTVKNVNVLLPTIMTVNIAAISTVCEPAQANARACPGNTRIGSATINTPLLPYPVVGSVFVARSVSGSTLPDLLIEIPPPINIQIRGANRFVNQIQIESTFSNLPDLIWDSMTMQIAGGPNGLIGLRSSGACGNANVNFGSHSGQGTSGQGVVSGLALCGAIREICDNPAINISSRGLKKRRNKKFSTSITFRSDGRCPGIKSFGVIFPKGTKIYSSKLKYSKKRGLSRKLKRRYKNNLKSIRGKFGKKRMDTRSFRRYGRYGLKLKGNLPPDVNLVTMATKNSSLKLKPQTFCKLLRGKTRKARSRALRKCKKKKVTFTFLVTRADGSKLKFKRKVRANDRRFR